MYEPLIQVSARLGLGVLIAASGCDGALGATSLPHCADGQGLSTDAKGAFLCAPALVSALSVTLPAHGCSSGRGLYYYQADPSQVSCRELTIPLTDNENRGAELRSHIDTLTRQVESLGQTVAQLQALGKRYEPIYVGSTSRKTTGRIAVDGQAGLIAAASLCAAEFGAGARMCTPSQLVRSVALGRLTTSQRIAPAWVYMPTWHNPKNSTTEPLAGLADNCGGYSTGSDTAGWTGKAVEWGPLPSGDVAFRWHGGDQAACSASLPIACCAGVRP